MLDYKVVAKMEFEAYWSSLELDFLPNYSLQTVKTTAEHAFLSGWCKGTENFLERLNKTVERVNNG